MRRTPHRRLLATTLLAASVLIPSTAAPAAVAHAAGAVDRHGRHDCPQSGLGPTLNARLDTAIDDVRRQAGIPGAVVGLWLPGKGCYVRASGVADTVTQQPMTTDSFVRIGSETKTFTATALLQLVDQHRVRLDDPISRYISGVPNGRRITLRHLLEMRSGLFPYTSDPDFVQALLSDPQRSYTPRELLAYGFKHANTFAPGAQFEYSNTNFVLLGLVIEKVTGHRFGDVIDAQVLRPSGLRHTLLPRGAQFPQPHPHGYTNQTLDGSVADATNWNPSWAWAAGAMISNLHDLRRWAEIVATGKLLSPRTQAQRLQTLPTGFPGTDYGLGIFETNGWIGHNGSIPGYETVTVYLPSQKATMVIMINTDSTSQGQEPSTLLARAITEIVTPDNVYAGAVVTH
ncbi:beta-lactamase family protein [Streptomyces spinosirectus]|jgi:D-alanyl-D-alanine carboxypeptidase|uniref:serine hydrolase domain-containing protein n=1 Tax=Streptomyces TaxID=1883 RepID=UPI000D3D7607|nr:MULTISPECIES: serine hydrolase domain-containing protein [Streptomyces]PTM89952.1 D-alanyl-D-alanine carboxypeptidase [Streptomyces sp. VMFN-G11Ma]UIR22372.1 beta-lactamase family protein [Streptomyces spinosirectus]